MPKVSICIPSYNNVECVKQLMASVFSQDYTDFEVILSDDSTNRETEDFIRSVYSNRVRYYHNEKPLGHIYNWNQAISHAKGEYIKIMFSDDWFTDSRSLGTLVRLLDRNPRADLAFSGSLQVSDQESHARAAGDEYIRSLRSDFRRLFMGNEIGAPSAVLYRAGGRPALFDERSNWASDVFLYFDILQKNPEFACTREPLISIGVHENQYTEMFDRHDIRKYEDYRYLYQKYHLRECPEVKAYFLNEFILGFKRGVREALNCGFTAAEYTKAFVPWFWKSIVVSYARAAWRRLKCEKKF